MDDQIRQFDDALEQLYAVFAKYPLRRDTGMCPCCHEPEEERLLHSKPLRELTGDDLDDFAWSALLTWGTEKELKHFLPRLLELLACDQFSREDVYLMTKLPLAHWRQWPEVEQKAVEEFFEALWRRALTDPDFKKNIDDLLSGIGQAVDDLTPYLQYWRSSTNADALHRLALFVIHNEGTLRGSGVLANASFWIDTSPSSCGFHNDRRAQMEQVVDWLVAPATRETLEQAYLLDPSQPSADDMARAADILKRLAE